MRHHFIFVGQRREPGPDFAADADDRLIQRLPRLDTDQHHVQRVGETVHNLLLAGLAAAFDPILRQVIADTAGNDHRHRQFDRRHRFAMVGQDRIGDAKDQRADAQNELGGVKGADCVFRFIARLQHLQLGRRQVFGLLRFKECGELVQLVVLAAKPQGAFAVFHVLDWGFRAVPG